MTFIPDQGWFYLSARDIILTGKIPLVGPETSHPWIHHGPLWTYVLAIILWVFSFNPVPPAYFIAGLGVVTVFLLYKISSELFTKKIGLIAAFLFATSPLIILNARMPYHTSLIPFFTILLMYLVYKWTKGNLYFFPLITFLMGVLYNHELTTFVLFIPILFLVVYGFWKKKKYAGGLLNKKVITLSILSFLVPMIPFILYDINHGYKQTAGFIAWVLYRIIKLPLNIFSFNDVSYRSQELFSLDFLIYIKQLIFAPNLWVSLLIFITSIIYLIYLMLMIYSSREGVPSGTPESRSFQIDSSRQARTINYKIGYVLLFLYLIVPTTGLFMHRIPIEADTLLISPFIIIMIAVFINKLLSVSFLKVAVIAVIGAICVFNSYYLLSTEYLTKMDNGSRLTFEERVRAVDSVIKLAQGRNFNIVGKGRLSFFPAFTMPYEYLLWWKGHPSSKEKVELKIVVWEKDGNIIVYEEK